MLEEPFQRGIDLRIGAAVAKGDERFLDHAPGAEADPRPDGLSWHRRMSQRQKRVVGGVDEVRGGVDKSAVEVKDEGEVAHGALHKDLLVSLAARPCHVTADGLKARLAAPNTWGSM